MAGYGFDPDPYIDDSSQNKKKPVAGTTGFNVIPSSSQRTVDVNRPTSTSQSSTQTGTQTGAQTGKTSGTSESTQTIEFTGERPTDLVKPEWNEGEIKKRAQQIAAPQIRQLRQAVQQALVKHYENPNVRKMMVRSALQGYGIGLGGVVAQSQSAASSEYAKKYSFDMQVAMANFNAAWNEYLGARKTSTVGATTGTTEGTTTGTTTGTNVGATDYTYQGGSEPESDIYSGPAVFGVGKRGSSRWDFGGISGAMFRY